MIIDVNPQTITGIAQTIANAYGEVEEAARILTSITEHNNWNCKERDAINDYTRSNAQEILKISEKSGNFANVMKVVAENFTTDEKNISEMFTSVERASLPPCLRSSRSEVGLRQAISRRV